MRILSTDPDVPGVFAVGQIATGIFALGQMATGFVAVGQVARGVIVVGQGAIGIIAIGQGTVAVGWGVGMVAIVGRGYGLVARLLPKYRPDRGKPELPPLSNLEEIRQTRNGWIAARVRDHALVDESGAALQVPLTDDVMRGLADAEDARAVVNVIVHETVANEGGSYRQAARVDLTFRAVAVRTWNLWPWPFEAIQGQGVAPAWELVLRGLGWVALAVGWWIVVGQALVGMFTK